MTLMEKTLTVPYLVNLQQCDPIKLLEMQVLVNIWTGIITSRSLT